MEGKLPDKTLPIVVYCAGGTRSAFAAKTLGDLGYSDVVSMAGGFNRWKDEGSPGPPAGPEPDQRNRYQRHLLLPEVGEVGQQKLLDAKVLLLGAGGLGSPAALYLAAGVGTLGIIDMDVVDASNLQRQILHNMERIGDRKVDSAKKTLTAMNPDVDVATYDVRLGADNVARDLRRVRPHRRRHRQLPDPVPRERRVADASIPVVHGSIFRFEGQVTVFNPYVGPCYRCMFPEPPPPSWRRPAPRRGSSACCPASSGRSRRSRPSRSCLGSGTPGGRLLAYDVLEESFRTFNVRRDPNCPACGPEAERS